jgi:hypothetical protein
VARIQVPAYDPAAQFPGGWALWQLPRPEHGSPLWIELKLANPGVPAKWGAQRVFRLCWGVDVGRLRRGRDALALREHQPALYEAVVRLLAASYTPARLEARIGRDALEVERGRVAEAAARVKAAKALRRMLS